MSTRSGRVRTAAVESSPPRTRPSRSPARTRKFSPSRKSPPARQTAAKSPSRKSPSRKTTSSKFPARKSPARITKEPVEVKDPPSAPKSPVKRPTIKNDLLVKLDDLTAKLESFRSTRSKRIEYSVNDVINTQSEFTLEKINGIEPITEVYGLRNRRSVDEMTPRRSNRLREFMENVPDLPDIRRSASKSSKSISKSVSRSIDTFSDEEHSNEEFNKENPKSVTRKLSTPLRNSINNLTQIAGRWEFGGRVGTAALIILIPLTVITILTACMKSCSIQTILNFSPFKSLSLWFSWNSALIITGHMLIQAIITSLPILGIKADRMDGSGTKQCFNGIFSFFIILPLMLTLDTFGYIQTQTLLRDYLKLATASYIYAVILSIVMYVKGQKQDADKLNPYGNTGYFLYDFFVGREIHPRIKMLDVKLFIMRISYVTTVVLLITIFVQGITVVPQEVRKLAKTGNYEDFLTTIQYQPTILIFAMMQVLYMTYFITNEYRVTSTFYWQSEGLGYMQIVSSALYPFYFTSLSKYVADVNLSLSTNTLLYAVGVFLAGFTIMLRANNIKHEFRRDPLQPGLARMDSMATFHGKRLLLSDLWGTLRHPNYTGDILIHIALAFPGLITGQIIAASPALITILILMHRAWRDDARCKRRYGAAWARYCKRVPYVLIPKVL